ncbi:MAG: multidrug effflux MFS transporter [Novosphingobium sp.]|nr:multidrug effflux MFS transporter [Novosphingobium sp.]
MATSPTLAEKPFPLREGELVTLLAFTQALQALAIDAMLPGIGTIASDLNASDPNQRQWIVGVFLIGCGVGALVPGTLADRFGRRPIILASLACYVVMAAACAMVTDFETLLAFRFIQAVGSGGLAVLPSAIIRDRFEGDKMARLLSLIGVIFMIVPMIAPTLGQGVLAVAGWRWIFWLTAFLGIVMTIWIWFRLPETQHPEFRQKIDLATIGRNMATTLTTRASIGYVFGSALILGAMWGYIQSSQQLIAEHFGAGESFPLFFGGMALCMAAANFGNSRIVERFGARRVSHAAVFAFIVIAALQLYLALRPNQTLWQFVPVMTANMCLMGFIGANFASIAIQPFERIAGSASSVQAFLRMVTASLLGAAIGQSYDGSATPFAASLLAAGIGCLGLILFSERGQLFRRIYPRGAVRPVVAP